LDPSNLTISIGNVSIWSAPAFATGLELGSKNRHNYVNVTQREVIRSRKSKNRQHNAQKKNDKETNNDLQNITTKTKDRAT
jgi:hypothetical protein